MKRLIELFSVAAMPLLLTGCMSVLGATDAITGINTSRMMSQNRLMQQLMKEPDVPEWYTQREQVTQAMGDRVFDKDFNRVFDSLIVALASMGMTVDNMERQSGYIAAHGQLLPPESAKQLRSEELAAWCKANGYDPSLVESRHGDMIDPDMSGGMMGKISTTLTISLIKQSEKQTKAKLRFNGIYYPRRLEESFKALWPALDKQIFMDKGTD
jgi:hypothetical protein